MKSIGKSILTVNGGSSNISIKLGLLCVPEMSSDSRGGCRGDVLLSNKKMDRRICGRVVAAGLADFLRGASVKTHPSFERGFPGAGLDNLKNKENANLGSAEVCRDKVCVMCTNELLVIARAACRILEVGTRAFRINP